MAPDHFNGVFPLSRAMPLRGGLTAGLAVKKRRSSSSPEDSRREKIPHLDQPCSSKPYNFNDGSAEEASTSTSTSIVDKNYLSSLKQIVVSERKDVNLTAELFWLRTHLSEHWSMKWLWQYIYIYIYIYI
uniref:Uncharacterized protein n=1 Tax=Heterorhabditis bacteriophora TaxID=37862 RepID=A0A1I7WVE7_HETBA